MTTTAIRGVCLIAGSFLVATGLWAFVDPRSFFDVLATYPPFNEHLFHDVGAFQIGLGATLLLALVRSDALFVASLGVGVGAAAHTLSHVIDRDLGGRPSDPFLLGLMAVALIAAAVARSRRSST